MFRKILNLKQKIFLVCMFKSEYISKLSLFVMHAKNGIWYSRHCFMSHPDPKAWRHIVILLEQYYLDLP